MAFWNRKKKQQDAPVRESTFKEKVADFWEWYSERAQSHYAMLQGNQRGDLTSEVMRKLDDFWEDFSWVFGPGPQENEGYSFSLSGGGNLHRQFLTKYWLEQAPDLDGGTCYSSRQPGIIKEGMSIRIDGNSFEFGGLWVSAKPDLENENVDITAWHPLFNEVEKNVQDTVLFWRSMKCLENSVPTCGWEPLRRAIPS